MFEGIPAWVFQELTPWAIIGILALGLFTGRFIVPIVWFNEMKADRNRWRESSESLAKSVGVFAVAFPELLEVGKSVDKVMTVVKQKADADIEAERER